MQAVTAPRRLSALYRRGGYLNKETSHDTHADSLVCSSSAFA